MTRDEPDHHFLRPKYVMRTIPRNRRTWRVAAAALALVVPVAAHAADAPPVAFTPAPVAAAPTERIDDVYQWSLPMPSADFERRAYLWVPPGCTHVKGVVVGLQNMLDKLMFQNGDFRDACAAADVAIVYVAPGSVSTDKAKEPPLGSPSRRWHKPRANRG